MNIQDMKFHVCLLGTEKSEKNNNTEIRRKTNSRIQNNAHNMNIYYYSLQSKDNPSIQLGQNGNNKHLSI